MSPIALEITIGVLKIFSIILPVLISVALLVYLERKVLGAIQLRRGPNVVGPFGILQSFADVIKLITKENLLPSSSNKFLFIFAPMLTLILSLIACEMVPKVRSLMADTTLVKLACFMTVTEKDEKMPVVKSMLNMIFMTLE